MAGGQKDVARGQEEVARGQEQVARGQEQVELDEEVGEVGAVNRAAGGEPGASSTLWTPQPKEVEEVGAVTRSSGGEPGASPTPWTPQPPPAGDERLLEVPLLDRPLLAEEEVKDQVEVEACARDARPS